MSIDLLLPPKQSKDSRYTFLKAEQILMTIERLAQRIEERFPESGLLQVCREFLALARHSEQLAVRLREPVWLVRTVAVASSVLLLGVAGYAVNTAMRSIPPGQSDLITLVQVTESAINELILLALALFFLFGMETRLKRNSALQALHRLRSIAHVVDMHQLTKDPAHLLAGARNTQASPTRTLTRFELARYLDYCSEMLALNSKIAALFAQNMDDPVVLNAVNDLESLTQGLAAKIWQKIMILDLAEGN